MIVSSVYEALSMVSLRVALRALSVRTSVSVRVGTASGAVAGTVRLVVGITTVHREVISSINSCVDISPEGC